MIGQLRGTVAAIGESICIIDVGGVGYEVQASARALRTMTLGAEVRLTIDTHVRDDAIRLYGFSSEVERTWFRTLQKLQGVGAKVALAILGILPPQDLANAIALGNWQAVEQAPGVGKRIAQRIVTELKDKVPTLSIDGVGGGTALAGTGAGGVGNAASGDAGGEARGDAEGDAAAGLAAAEAISALTNLGYAPAEATRAVAAAMQDLGSAADTAALIRRGLKELSR